MQAPLLEQLLERYIGSRSLMHETERQHLLGTLLDRSFQPGQVIGRPPKPGLRVACATPSNRGVLLDWVVLLAPEMLFHPGTAPLSPHAPKAVTYHEQPHYCRFMIPCALGCGHHEQFYCCRFMIGHSLERMDISYLLTTFPFI